MTPEQVAQWGDNIAMFLASYLTLMPDKANTVGVSEERLHLVFKDALQGYFSRQKKLQQYTFESVRRIGYEMEVGDILTGTASQGTTVLNILSMNHYTQFHQFASCCSIHDTINFPYPPITTIASSGHIPAEGDITKVARDVENVRFAVQSVVSHLQSVGATVVKTFTNSNNHKFMFEAIKEFSWSVEFIYRITRIK